MSGTVPTAALTITPPAVPAERFHAGNGLPTPSWQLWFNQTGEYNKQVGAGVTQAQLSAAQASAASATATTNAQAAAQQAEDVGKQLDAIQSAGLLWLIGSYQATALASLGSSWLRCDGSAYSTIDYPDLAKVLKGLTPDGRLPSIAAVNDPSNPVGPPVLTWYVRAK